MDLSSSYPRSPRETLWGYVHLARMIDKCRAAKKGTLGEYIYPCPMDRMLLSFLGISAENFLEAANQQDEEGLGAWLAHQGLVHTQEEISQWNETLLTRRPDNEDKQAYFSECLAKIAPARTDITCWADLLDLEEGRPVPLRS